MPREVYLGDARVVLRGRVPAGCVVITDPPWPVQSAGQYEGGHYEPGLLREVLEVCSLARRVVIIASALTDPRWLAEVDVARWRFVTTGWLRYTVPSYRGTLLLPGNVAHVFGDHRATTGRRVIPCEMTTPAGERSNSQHPTPLRMSHARWCVGQYTNEGDTVVDPFFGSGAILRAGVEAGCGVIGAEQNEAYFDEGRASIVAPNLLDGAWNG